MPRRPADIGTTLDKLAAELGAPQEFFVDGSTARTSAAEQIRRHLPHLAPWCHDPDGNDWVGCLRQRWTSSFVEALLTPTPAWWKIPPKATRNY